LIIEIGSVRGRFGREDVDGGTGEFARLEAVDEGGDIDDFTSSVVEEVSSVLHLRDLFGTDEVGRFGEFGNVESDEITLVEKGFESVDLLGGSEGHDRDDIVVEDRHSHRFGKDRELRTDVTVSDNLRKRMRMRRFRGKRDVTRYRTHTESFSPDFPASLADLVPDTLPHLVGTITDLPRKGDNFGNHEFCDRSRVGEGRVEDGDTGLGGGEEVDLVRSDTEATNNEKLSERTCGFSIFGISFEVRFERYSR
jgi:hypothetical protein